MVAALAGVRGVPETAPRSAPGQVGPRGAGGARRQGSKPFGRREIEVLARQLPVAPWAFGLPAISMAVVPGLLRALVARPVIYSASLIVVTLASGMAVQPLTGRIGSRGDRQGLAAGAAGVFLAACAIAWRSPPLAYAASILIGAGYGLVMTTGLREVSEQVAGEHRGTAVGIYYVLTYLGFAVPFVHAVVAKVWGDVATSFAAGFAVIASLAVRAAIARRPRVAA
jgi:hypothetical protein